MKHFDVFKKELDLFEKELIIFPIIRFSYRIPIKSYKEGSLGSQGPKGSREPKSRDTQ
jgi:hypothetical protein